MKLDERLSFNLPAFMAMPRPTSYDHRNATSLYVIRSEGYCKVGIASDVEKRLEAFRAGNPHPMTLVRHYPFNSRLYALVAERTTHKVLADYSVGREWFMIEPKLAANAASWVCMYTRKLADRWERAGHEKLRAEQRRYQTDPEYRTEKDAEHAKRKEGWKAIVDEHEQVDEFRRQVRHQRDIERGLIASQTNP